MAEHGEPAFAPGREAGLALARELLSTYPASSPVWHYEHGLLFHAACAAGEAFGDPDLSERALDLAGALIGEDGSIATYRSEEKNLDQVNPGRNLFTLLERRGEARFRKAIETLRGQLREQPRTPSGGYWHKLIYPDQMWLDGLYMAEPFAARYATTFAEPALLDECERQFALMESKARDPGTGLLHHAWDESRAQLWANPETGASPCFWGRAMGWYAMALVDCWELFPAEHGGRATLAAILARLGAAARAFQDGSTGLWHQVVDRAGEKGNYLEASVSAMFAYAFAKAFRLGMVADAGLEAMAARAYEGCLARFLVRDGGGKPRFEGTCAVAGLGGKPYRDGSYEYYIGEPVKANDYKGAAPFILASVEYELATERRGRGGHR